jgi:cytochrome c peroxidase
MNEIGIGLIAVAVASTMLLLAVTRELAPAGGLTGRGRWLLAAGLGTGVLAFGFKLTVIALTLAAPASWLRADLKAQPAERTAGLADPAMPVQRHRWQALARSAPAPADNPTTQAKVELGRALFLDRNLSSTREVACASCHDLYERAGADGRRVARGIDGLTGERNAPTVWNAAFQARLFWDGRAASLEEQAKGPFVNAREMGMPSLADVVARVQAQPAYRAAFTAAFEDDAVISIERVAQAISAFERTLITPDTPYDRFVRGDDGALSRRQLRGMALFESFGCVQCHAGPNFSAASVFDTQAPMRAFPALQTQGLEALDLAHDPGLYGAPAGSGVWRVPSLRNVALTGPYFHNGSVAQLDEAVRIMLRAQLGVVVDGLSPAAPRVARAPGQDPELRTPVVATRDDVQSIVAFLESLSGDFAALRQASQAQRGH